MTSGGATAASSTPVRLSTFKEMKGLMGLKLHDPRSSQENLHAMSERKTFGLRTFHNRNSGSHHNFGSGPSQQLVQRSVDFDETWLWFKGVQV